MIEKMTKYSFILLSGDKEDFLTGLGDLGLVDIVRSAKPVDERSATLFAKAGEYKKAISSLEALEDDAVPAKGEVTTPEEIFETLSKLGIEKLDKKELQARLEETALWGSYNPQRIKELEESGCVIRFYDVPRKKFNPDWGQLQALEVVWESKDRVRFVTASYDKDYSFPEAPCEAPSKTVEELRASIEKSESRIELIKMRLCKMKDMLPALKEQYATILQNLDRHLADVTVQTAAEDALCIYTGYAPTEKDAELARAFDNMPVYYIQEKATAQDRPPISLKNNKFTRMFTVLTDMYGRPAYDGFDPTPYISVFFMLFFAFCMGDAGYGIALTLAGILLRKAKGFASLAPLVVTLGIATIVIGFLFHTFFSIDISTWESMEPIKGIFLPSKIAGYDGTMVLAILVGIVHICLALVVKTIYATKNKGFLGSLGTWGWTLLIVGGIVVGGLSLGGVLDAAVTKIVVIVIGILSALGIFLLNDLHRNPLLNIGAGLWETYNTATGLLGDVLSYLRLYALGLAGAMLGYAFNDLGGQVLGDGAILNWVFFVLVVLIGHVLNMAMAALGAFVHPLRLNFLEFFKNSGYEGGARIYDPLKNTIDK